MSDVYDVVIVGAGVAGMTAAIYARRAGKTVLLIENQMAGGQIVNALDVRNWPGEESVSGQKLTERIYHQVNNFGAEMVYDRVKGVRREGSSAGGKKGVPAVAEEDGAATAGGESAEAGKDVVVDSQEGEFVIVGEEGEYRGRAVILATGSRDRPLGVPNEEKLIGHGISYCATCDGELYRGKDVLVVGGGNTAMYDVLYLAGLARKVYLVHRREDFRAEVALVEKVRQLENVEMILGATPRLVDDGEKVTGFYAVKAEAGTEGAASSGDSVTGVGDAEAGSADSAARPVAAVFVAIGREPNTTEFAELVKLDENGYVAAGEDCKTSCPGAFAAGDCRAKSLRQLVTAASDGAVAATGAVEYLNR